MRIEKCGYKNNEKSTFFRIFAHDLLFGFKKKRNGGSQNTCMNPACVGSVGKKLR